MKRFKRIAFFGILLLTLSTALAYGCSLVGVHDAADEKPATSDH